MPVTPAKMVAENIALSKRNMLFCCKAIGAIEKADVEGIIQSSKE